MNQQLLIIFCACCLPRAVRSLVFANCLPASVVPVVPFSRLGQPPASLGQLPPFSSLPTLLVPSVRFSLCSGPHEYIMYVPSQQASLQGAHQCFALTAATRHDGQRSDCPLSYGVLPMYSVRSTPRVRSMYIAMHEGQAAARQPHTPTEAEKKEKNRLDSARRPLYFLIWRRHCHGSESDWVPSQRAHILMGGQYTAEALQPCPLHMFPSAFTPFFSVCPFLFFCLLFHASCAIGGGAATCPPFFLVCATGLFVCACVCAKRKDGKFFSRRGFGRAVIFWAGFLWVGGHGIHRMARPWQGTFFRPSGSGSPGRLNQLGGTRPGWLSLGVIFFLLLPGALLLRHAASVGIPAPA